MCFLIDEYNTFNPIKVKINGLVTNFNVAINNSTLPPPLYQFPN